MRIDSPVFHAANTARQKQPRYVVAIIYDVDSIYITSHDDIPNVPGTVISGALEEPTITSQTINPDEASAQIGNASISLVDLASAFTDEVRERLGDGSGLRGRECRFYLGYAGMDFSAFRLYGTQIIHSASYKSGRYSVRCLDIQRTLRTDIFNLKTTTLTESIAAAATTIPVDSVDGFQMLAHGPSYTDAPNQTVGYIKIKDEIIRYSGVQTSPSHAFTGCVRGLFGTVAATYTVDTATPVDRRERITEHVYLELPAIKLALAILTGQLYNDGTSLPDGWHLGMDSRWVTEADFVSIGADLWDPADDRNGFPVRFLGLMRQDAKRFLEREIYLLTGTFSPVYSDGSVGLRRMTRISEDAATVMTLDETNSVQVGDLEHDMQSLHNVFEVNWSWDGDSFRRTTGFIDADSFSTHGRAPLHAMSFKGLVGGKHTDATVFSTLDMVRDRYAGPPLRLPVELLPSCNALEIGDVVRVRYKNVRDFTGPEPLPGGPGINRAMEVQGISINHLNGRPRISLFGSTATPSVNSPTSAEVALPNGFYTAAGSPLASAPGITIIGNVVTAATQPLVGDNLLTGADSIYYHDGDLEIADDVELTIQKNIQLRVRGFLQINGHINGVGGGHPGVADDGRAIRIVNEFAGTEHPPIPMFGGTGVSAEYPIQGIPGYVGNSRGYDGVHKWMDALGVRIFGTTVAALTRSRNEVAPRLALRVDGLDLLGLPDDLRGTGGPPGGRSTDAIDTDPPNDSAFLGGPGAAGGAGLCIICRGMALGVDGLIDISGADSVPTTLQTKDDVDRYAGPGGGGGPGTMYVFMDGANLSLPDLSGNRFRARNGIATPLGNPIEARHGTVVQVSGIYQGPLPYGTEPITGYRDPQFVTNNGADLSGSALQVQYIPAAETPTDDEESRPPPPTGLSATGVELGISIVLTLPDFEQFDIVEIYGALTNDRTGASLIARGRTDTFRHQLPASSTRYYWARTRRAGVSSTFYPESATGGISATSLAGGSGSNGESIEVQYSANGSTWHDPPFVTGDLYMRQRVGSSGAWSSAIRIVGEAGAPGAAGSTGNFIDIIFRRSATQPATPTGNSPSGWSDGPPADDGNPVWMSTAEKTAANVLVGVWSVPAIVSGPSGKGWLSGTGAPAGSLGTINDFYLDTTTDQYYRKTGASTWTLIGTLQGAPGADGDDGTVWHTGVGVPSNGLGAVGDWYLDSASGNYHEKTGASTWTLRGNLRGPEGAPGAAAQLIRLTASPQAFTFSAAGSPSPASQTITLTATRQNIATATIWSTTPSVTLGGSGDTRTLTVANFGGNSSVRVRAESSGHFDEITIVRLNHGATGENGQPAIVGFLTNESHSLAADPEGVVSDYSSANGIFRVFEGVLDRTAFATFSISTQSGCTAQINTADNIPVNGQPRGFYRITGISADQAYVELQASYNGVTVPKRFSVTRSRQGIPGDGANLLRVEDWQVGTTGSQGGGRWSQNGQTSENAIVLGGAGTAPIGPLGITEPLWECRPSGDGAGDGGWDYANIAVDRTKTYRSVVWFRVNTPGHGQFYHGCGVENQILHLNGSPNGNPYFNFGSTSLFEANQWYLSVGIVHGSGYTGGYSGITGIYDPRTGKKIANGNEFKFSPSTSVNYDRHRAYHFYNTTSTSFRQWMARPRYEEINGNEPSIWDLMGIRLPTPWIERGYCFAGQTSFHKVGGVNAWDSDVYSVAGYRTCHLQWKPGRLDQNVMVGLNSDPASNADYTSIDYAWYVHPGGLQIYENGALIGAEVAVTTETELAIVRDEATGIVTYYRDRVAIRTVGGTANVPYYLDSSFHTPGALVNSVKFGPGTTLESISTPDVAPGSMSGHYQSSLIGPITQSANVGSGPRNVDVHTLTFTPVASGYVTTTLNAIVTGSSGAANPSVSIRVDGGEYVLGTEVGGLTNFPISKTGVVPVVAGVPTTLRVLLKLPWRADTGGSSITISNIEIVADLFLR